MDVDRNLVALLGQRFIARRDVKSWQAKNGAWYPEESPMTMADFGAHLSGQKTMGHYLIDPATNTCKLFALDLDWIKPQLDPTKGPIVDPKWHDDDIDEDVSFNPREVWLQDDHPFRPMMNAQMRSLADGLAMRIHRVLGIDVAIADSGGKGLHVYGLCGDVPAEAAREMVVSIMESYLFEAVRGKNFWRHPFAYKNIEIETFPKQVTVNEGGFGNLMALPLGINQKTGRAKAFVRADVGLNRIVPMDPFRALEGDLPWGE